MNLLKIVFISITSIIKQDKVKTSDAEFIVENSLYPLDRGSVFFTHATNEYTATPEQLKKYGYSSAVFHSNDKTFWNRDVMYPALGYDRYFNLNDYVGTEQMSVGWGLKDKEFFEQSIPKLKSLPQPFYTKFITLTNHFPFLLNPEDQYVDEFNSESGVVNRYFPTVRYTDEALKQFIKQLKEEGLYDNSVIVIYMEIITVFLKTITQLWLSSLGKTLLHRLILCNYNVSLSSFTCLVKKVKSFLKCLVKLILNQRYFIYLVLKQINQLNLELTYLLKKKTLLW